MLIKITIKTSKGDITRDYDWDIDGDHLDKGEKIEEMMATLEDSNKHRF